MDNQKDSLKILVIFNSLINVIGGGSRHIVEVANRWVESNEVHYLISDEGYNVAMSHFGTSHKNKKIIKYSAPFDSTRKYHLAYISRTLKSIYICSKLRNQYDVVIAPNYLPQNIIPAVFMANKNTKLVVYFHTTAPKERKNYLKSINYVKRTVSLTNWWLCTIISKKYFDLIFVVNESTKEYFLHKGILNEKLHVISNATPYKLIASIKAPPIKEYTCVFLGRLVKSKGILDLVKVWSLVTVDYPTAKLCIIGDGPDKKELEEEIRTNLLENNILVYGQAESTIKYEIMKNAEIFLYPSHYEAQPVVVLEALACELVVVAYNLSTYKEFYQDYLNIVEIGNIQAMAGLVKDIMREPTKYELRKPEIKSFVSKYDWDLVSKQQELLISN